MPWDNDNDSKPNSIDIHSNKGDVIGVGVDGNGNIIGKNISVVINEFSQDCGLTLLAPNHFKENVDTIENFSQWREKGYAFSLESIYQRKEFRRKKLLKEIKDKLEDKKRLLLLGDSETSKTTLLMETISDYFDEGYRVIYNLGDDDLKNTNTIYDKIRCLVDGNNKVLIVIDNVHSPRTSLIFNVIKKIQPLDKAKKDNMRFLLAARTPEFDWALERNLFQNVELQTIKSLFDDQYKFTVKPFEKEEVREFILLYRPFLNQSIKNKPLEQNTEEIFKDTKGHPIMVRFAVLNKGLTAHVEQMYAEYLQDRNNNNYPHKERVKVIILNSLFDISNISLTDKILEDFGLLSIANGELKNAIIRKSGEYWSTIHPKWDMELFRHMFSLEYSLDDIQSSFKDTISKIIKYVKIDTFSLLFILYTIYYTFTKEKVISPNIIENNINITDIEKKFDVFLKLWYCHVIGLFYLETKRNRLAIEFFDKAQGIDSKYLDAYNNKGLSLSNLGRDEDAIVEYDKVTSIDESYVNAYNNKGSSLSNLGRDEDAIVEYDKALEIDSNYVSAYYNKGLSLFKLGRDEDAIVEYDKALEINPSDAGAYYNKGRSLFKLGRDEDAIVEYDKALKINPSDAGAYNNKGLSLSNLGRYEDAIVEYDKAIEIDSNLVSAYNSKGLSLSILGKYEEALMEFDKALKINPSDVNAYDNKGNSLSRLGRYEDAIREYDKALKINPSDVNAYNNKGNSLSNLSRDEDAIVEYR